MKSVEHFRKKVLEMGGLPRRSEKRCQEYGKKVAKEIEK